MTKVTSTGTNPPLGPRKGFQDIAGNNESMENLFNNYIRSVLSWKKKEKTNEVLMKYIEDKLKITTDTSRTEHRNWIIEQIDIGNGEGKPFTLKTDQKLEKALEDVLIEQHQAVNLPQFPQYSKEELEIIKKRLTEQLEYFSFSAPIDPNRRWPRTDAERTDYLIAYSPGEPELLSHLPSEKPWGFVLKGNDRRLCYDLQKNEVEIIAGPNTVYNRNYISGVYKKVNDTDRSPIDFIKNVVLKEVDDKVLSSDSKKAIIDALPKLEKLLEKAGYTRE